MKNHLTLLGKTHGGEKIFLPNKAENKHISITGMSGFGKSTLLHNLEINLVRSGNPVFVLNFHNTHTPKAIYSGIREDFLGSANYIDIPSDGIPLPLWTPSDKGQKAEVSEVLSKLEQACKLGDIQSGILEEVLNDIYLTRDSYSNQLQPIEEYIGQMERQDRLRISRRLSPLFRIQIIPHLDKLKPEAINIFDVSDFDEETQKVAVNLLLCIIKDFAKKRTRLNDAEAKTLYLVLDEYQGLDFGTRSPLRAFLTESRKYNIGVILSTQELEAFTRSQKNDIGQAATKIYFRQTDSSARSLAKVLFPRNQADEMCIHLQQLPLGDFLLRGRKSLGYEDVDKPLIVHNYIP